LVTASASGLDPEISPAAAELQIPRVARERNMPESDVRSLAAKLTLARQFGILGEPRVRLPELTLDLDASHRQKSSLRAIRRGPRPAVSRNGEAGT
jgi:K+-transporting ATPase ATPase C chain